MEEIEKAAQILKNGGVIVYPTDTAVGIGARIDDSVAVERLFQIKGRPENKPTPILVSSIEMAAKYVDEIPEEVQYLMEKHWPGGLTIVLESSSESVTPLVKGGTNTLGVRMPDQETLLQVIEKVGVPIVGSSANLSGEKTPFDIKEVDPEIRDQVDFILKGVCKTKAPSTVIDCTHKKWKIIREGAVKLDLKEQ